MKKGLIFFIFFIQIFTVFAQGGFAFEKGVSKVTIPFQLINNLIFIPIKVNGVELHFLLDSGVEETILFGMDEKKDVSFNNVEKILLRGLGSEESIEGLKSTNNLLEVNGLQSYNQLLYIVLDQSFNLSSHVGIPVNGIIGYHFLKSNLVEINYEKKRITVHIENEKVRKKIKSKYQSVPITIERSKPYIIGSIVLNSSPIPTKLLIDIGNSDAIWLFENTSKLVDVPKKHFVDYLGKGFSGDVEGKRAQIKNFSFSNFEFKNPIVAFPDSSSIRNVKMVKDRSGSIGAEILKRFNLFFDYSNQQLFVRTNSHYNDPFQYNKSGVEVQHHGLQWVQETVNLATVPYAENTGGSGKVVFSNFNYKFSLKPVYIVAYVRKNSPAALAGLQKEDVIVTINKRPAYEFTLEKITKLLRSETENWYSFEVERDNKMLNFKFQLQNVL